jgi:hypothetical protein
MRRELVGQLNCGLYGDKPVHEEITVDSEIRHLRATPRLRVCTAGRINKCSRENSGAKN